MLVTWIVERLVAKQTKVSSRFQDIIGSNLLFLKNNCFNQIIFLTKSENLERIRSISRSRKGTVNLSQHVPNTNKTLATTKEREKLFNNIKIEVKEVTGMVKNTIAEDQALHKPSIESRGTRIYSNTEKYEDQENDIQDRLLVPSKYLLYFTKQTTREAKADFGEYLYLQNRKVMIASNLILFVIFLAQTIIIASSRTEFGSNSLIFGMRATFLCLLLANVVFVNLLHRMRDYVTNVFYTYGILACVLQYYISRDKSYAESFQEIQLIELAFIYLVATACRY